MPGAPQADGPGAGSDPGGVVEAIFVAPSFGGAPRPVDTVEAVPGRGLRGDRYWREDRPDLRTDACEVTLISAEDLDAVEAETGLDVTAGEHRRNVVVRGLAIDDLAGHRFRVGEVVLAFERKRPPCRYLERLTQEGMRAALRQRGGICCRIVSGGVIAHGDAVLRLGATDAGGGAGRTGSGDQPASA